MQELWVSEHPEVAVQFARISKAFAANEGSTNCAER
jgi:hypothetical protein